VDFEYTPHEEAFRQELRTWLAVNPPAGYDPETFLYLDQEARFVIQLSWQKQLYCSLCVIQAAMRQRPSSMISLM
jgi:hypothetical protein